MLSKPTAVTARQAVMWKTSLSSGSAVQSPSKQKWSVPGLEAPYVPKVFLTHQSKYASENASGSANITVPATPTLNRGPKS